MQQVQKIANRFIFWFDAVLVDTKISRQQNVITKYNNIDILHEQIRPLRRLG